MMPDLASPESGAPTLCRPYSSSYFALENSLTANGIHVDIRRFGWEKDNQAQFRANSYYLDYSLVPRSFKSRLYYRDRPETPLPGRIVFLPKGVELAASNEACEMKLLCLTFDDHRAVDLFEGGVRHLDPCFDVRAPRIEQAMLRIAKELRAPGFGQDVLIESLALVMVVELCRQLADAGDGGDDRSARMADWRLGRLRERVEDGLCEGISVGKLAAECRMSRRHLIRTFKNTTGHTLSDYIADARVRRAKDQLANGDVMIKVIAHQCGFRSAAAFSTSFQKATGLTPKAFRQQNARDAQP